jgi:tetratricopeptide (TPR) repeat protein
MKKIILLLLICTLTSSLYVNAQISSVRILSDNEANYVKAHYGHIINYQDRRKGSSQVRTNNYPKKALKEGIYGDVVLSFMIQKDSILNNLALVKSPHQILTTHAIKEIGLFKNSWTPAMLNNEPISKEYLYVFRYLSSKNQPYDYNKKGLKFIQKQKYKKALKLYNKAIVDNPFDFELFDSLSKVKDALGDKEGAKKDYQTALYLKDNIMSVKTIVAPASVGPKGLKMKDGVAIVRSGSVSGGRR